MAIVAADGFKVGVDVVALAAATVGAGVGVGVGLATAGAGVTFFTGAAKRSSESPKRSSVFFAAAAAAAGLAAGFVAAADDFEAVGFFSPKRSSSPKRSAVRSTFFAAAADGVVAAAATGLGVGALVVDGFLTANKSSVSSKPKSIAVAFFVTAAAPVDAPVGVGMEATAGAATVVGFGVGFEIAKRSSVSPKRSTVEEADDFDGAAVAGFETAEGVAVALGLVAKRSSSSSKRDLAVFVDEGEVIGADADEVAVVTGVVEEAAAVVDETEVVAVVVVVVVVVVVAGAATGSDGLIGAKLGFVFCGGRFFVAEDEEVDAADDDDGTSPGVSTVVTPDASSIKVMALASGVADSIGAKDAALAVGRRVGRRLARRACSSTPAGFVESPASSLSSVTDGTPFGGRAPDM